MTPTRRAVLFTGAATASTALLPLPSPAAAAPGSPAVPGALPAATPPLASYWYPDSLPSGEPGEGITWRSLRGWRAEDDADLAFNASTVPLAPRFTPAPVNTTARAGQARVQSLVSFGPTAGNPSQGSPTADYYALTHWAYLDELVFWGGSAGEGLILAPNAPIVDAAHRHGVRVLGNIFLPPVVYGGQLRWTRDLVQKDAEGHYPLAERLVAVAAAYGFDGWFVNAETEGGDAALGDDMLGFLTELKKRAAARGQRVTWYDAMTVNGAVSWQGALNSRNEAFYEKADDMFVDFRWSPSSLASSAQLADGLGRDRYELWAGVDVESSGWNRAVNWDAIVPANAPHVTSLGFYRPEWTRNHLPQGHTPADFHAADDRFWSGRSLDPSRPDTTDGWRAPALSVADRSTVSSLPFATTFNTGHGLRWYEEGRVTSETPWNHLGLQDRLPSRRWVVRTEGARPRVAFDFADAWRGGNSVLVSGALTAPVTLDLYATRLPLRGGAVVDLTYREDGGAAVGVELAVATAEPAAGEAPPYTYLPVRPRHHGRAGGGWRTVSVRLPGRSGTVHALGVRLTAADGTPVAWRLGALAVRQADRPEHRPAPPTGLRVTAASKDALRLAWRPARGQVRQYTVHRVLPDGTRRFLGGTCQSAFHVAGLRPAEGERTARFEVRTVGEVYTASSPARLRHTW